MKVWKGVVSLLVFVGGCTHHDHVRTAEPVAPAKPVAHVDAPRPSVASDVNAPTSRPTPAVVDNASPDADNTRNNVVDRGPSLTPGDQSNAAPDLDITRAIRRGVVDRSGMSTDGKNIKIITRNGRVTLRGPVDSQDEMNFAVDLARHTDGVVAVDNQLQIVAAH